LGKIIGIGMNILVLLDDKWHPGYIVKDGLSFLDTSDNIITWIKDPNTLVEPLISFQLIIVAKANNISSKEFASWMTIELEKKMQHFVNNGGSLMVIHSGTSGYQECKIYRHLIGGVFDNHPEQCNVKYTQKDGISFTELDEHYFMAIDNIDNINIFLTSSSVHGEQSAGWYKSVGKGKVIVLTPGHNLNVWLNPIFKEIILCHIPH